MVTTFISSNPTTNRHSSEDEEASTAVTSQPTTVDRSQPMRTETSQPSTTDTPQLSNFGISEPPTGAISQSLTGQKIPLSVQPSIFGLSYASSGKRWVKGQPESAAKKRKRLKESGLTFRADDDTADASLIPVTASSYDFSQSSSTNRALPSLSSSGDNLSQSLTADTSDQLKAVSTATSGMSVDSVATNTRLYTEVDSSTKCKMKRQSETKVKGPSEWMRNKRKLLRERGLEYTSQDGTERQAKSLGKRCYCHAKSTDCPSLTEEDRQQIFNHIWNLTWREKRMFIAELLERHEPKRRYANKLSPGEKPKRAFTWEYHLRVRDKKIKVCKVMFASTTGLSQHFIQTAMDQPNQSHSRPNNPYYRRGNKSKEFACEFLDRLPKLPSLYYGQGSSHSYLEPQFRTMVDVHRLYVSTCTDKGLEALSMSLLTELCDSKNIALCRPLKEKCDMCAAYKTNELSEDQWKAHLKEMKRAEEEQARDKEKADKMDGTFVICLGLQGVVCVPAVNAPDAVFKAKLAVNNFSLYNMATRDTVCYVWHEAEGRLTANEFTSCVLDYLAALPTPVTKVVLYSAACVHQSMNSTLASALALFSMKHKVDVEQKFLVRGHEQVEVDSLHGCVDRLLKNIEIYAPTDYLTICKTAGSSSRTYHVKSLEHWFFKDYSQVAAYRTLSVLPVCGNRKSITTVNDLNRLRYTADGQVSFKRSFDEEWQSLPKVRGGSPSTSSLEPPGLYSSRLPLSESRFKDLQDLKAFMPVDYHPFYDSLPTSAVHLT